MRTALGSTVRAGLELSQLVGKSGWQRLLPADQTYGIAGAVAHQQPLTQQWRINGHRCQVKVARDHVRFREVREYGGELGGPGQLDPSCPRLLEEAGPLEGSEQDRTARARDELVLGRPRQGEQGALGQHVDRELRVRRPEAREHGGGGRSIPADRGRCGAHAEPG